MALTTRIWIAAFCFWVAVYLPQSTVGVQAKELANFSPVFVGGMWAIYGIALVLARIPIGIVSTIFKQKAFLLIVSLISVGMGLGTILIIPYPSSLLISRFLLGIGTGFWVIYTVFYVNISKKPTATAMSQITLAYGSGITVAGFAGGALVEWQGWLAPFLTGLLICAVAFFIVFPARKTEIIPTTFHTNRFFALFHNAHLIFVSFVAMIIFFVAFATVWGFSQNYAREHFGANPILLGILMFATLLPYSFCIGISHIIRNRLGLYQIITVGLILAGFGTIGIPFAPNMAFLIFLHMLIGVGVGALYPTLMAESISNVPVETKSEAMSIFQSIYAIGIFLGPFSAGKIIESFGFEYMFFAIGIMLLIAAFGVSALIIVSKKITILLIGEG